MKPSADAAAARDAASPRQPQKRRAEPLASRLSDEERLAHQAFLEALPQRALWLEPDADERI